MSTLLPVRRPKAGGRIEKPCSLFFFGEIAAGGYDTSAGSRPAKEDIFPGEQNVCPAGKHAGRHTIMSRSEKCSVFGFFPAQGIFCEEIGIFLKRHRNLLLYII